MILAFPINGKLYKLLFYLRIIKDDDFIIIMRPRTLEGSQAGQPVIPGARGTNVRNPSSLEASQAGQNNNPGPQNTPISNDDRVKEI